MGESAGTQPPRALPRRYWFQAATNRPTRVTGIKPSTMPQSRGSIIGTAGSVDVGSFFHDGSHDRDRSPPSVTAGSTNAPMPAPAEPVPSLPATSAPAPSRLIQALILLAISASLVLLLLLLGGARSDPYTRSTLELVGSEQNGGRLFRLNCAGCHGLAAQGLVGPATPSPASAICPRPASISSALCRWLTQARTRADPSFSSPSGRRSISTASTPCLAA